jgi:hypothetical protein
MRKSLNYGLAVSALVAAGVLGSSAANAVAIGDQHTYFFLSDHCSNGGCISDQVNGGYLTVTQADTGVVDVAVHLANNNQFIDAGFEASFGFNLADNPTITYSNIVPPLNVSYMIPGGLSPQQNAGALMMDGTGNFEYGLEGIGKGGSTLLGSDLTFTISGTGLDIGDFQGNVPQDQYFAADILSGTNGRTGAIDASNGVTEVPSPGNTLGLLGIGMIGTAGALRWNRRRQSQFAV